MVSNSNFSTTHTHSSKLVICLPYLPKPILPHHSVKFLSFTQVAASVNSVANQFVLWRIRQDGHDNSITLDFQRIVLDRLLTDNDRLFETQIRSSAVS